MYMLYLLVHLLEIHQMLLHYKSFLFAVMQPPERVLQPPKQSYRLNMHLQLSYIYSKREYLQWWYYKGSREDFRFLILPNY